MGAMNQSALAFVFPMYNPLFITSLFCISLFLSSGLVLPFGGRCVFHPPCFFTARIYPERFG